MPRPFEPQLFGKYFLCDRLAVGGMAEIFLARVQIKGAPESLLVIKRILPHFSGNSQFTDMFIDEARISFLLRHENIVPLHDLGKVENQFFLAMEWVVGQDLRAVVTRCRERGLRLSCEHAAWIVSRVCRGLDYAHTKTAPDGRPLHIIHRDVSPQNVLVGYDGQVKITDFGIAKAEDKLDSTQVGTLKGKFGYMAPEQVVAGGPPIDHRVDVFATGIILWELLTGQRLFVGVNEIEILQKVREARIEPPSSFLPDIPRDLERVLFRSLMKDRDKRYQSGSEMDADLTAFLNGASPGFGRANVAAVMGELFPDEIRLVRERWNVTVVDLGKAEQGARLEATRPGVRPPPGAETNTTTSPVRAAVKRNEETQPKTPAAGAVPQQRLTPEALLASIEGDLQTDTERVRSPARTTVSQEITEERTARRMRVRKWPIAGFAVVATLALLGSLFYMGQIPNPFAHSAIEVACPLDCSVRIDGNLVLASGREGRWSVGEGKRVVEIAKAGYEPLTQVVVLRRGGNAFVDGTLKPLAGAPADLPVISDPPGARVYFDSVPQAGTAPLTIHTQMGDHTVAFQLPGYGEQTLAVKVYHPGECPPVKVRLVPNLPPNGAAPVPSVPPGGDSANLPRGTGKGFLSLQVDGGWGEVWVDGVRISNQTPLLRAALAPGLRTVRVVNPVTRREKTIQVKIVADVLSVEHVQLE